MLFTDALAALQNGLYAARGAWDSTGEYCVLLPGMPYIWKILTQPTPNAGNWLPTLADLLADDWKVMPCKLEEAKVADAAAEPVV